MTFQIACSNSWSIIDFVGNADFVFFNENTDNSGKRVNLHKSFFMNYVRASVRNSWQYSICLN